MLGSTYNNQKQSKMFSDTFTMCSIVLTVAFLAVSRTSLVGSYLWQGSVFASSIVKIQREFHHSRPSDIATQPPSGGPAHALLRSQQINFIPQIDPGTRRINLSLVPGPTYR